MAAANEPCGPSGRGIVLDVKGLLRRVVVFIGLGAMINLLIAWGCATWTKPPLFDAFLTAEYRRARWRAEERRPRLKDEHLWIRRAYRGSGLHLLIVQQDLRGTQIVHLHRAGWPLPSMEGKEHNPLSPNTTRIGESSYSAGLPLPTKGTLLTPTITRGATTSPYVRVLPLLPVWPGFAINTLVYALAAMIVVGLWWLVRRAIRRMRGRCLSCGYDLRRDLATGCPECGWRRQPRATP